MKTLYSIRRRRMCPILLHLFALLSFLLWGAGTAQGQEAIENPAIAPSPAVPALLSVPEDAPTAAVSSGVIMVGVTIKKIAQIDDLDILTDQADFWVNVQIKSPSKSFSEDSPVWENQDVAEPNWTVRSAAKKGETVSIRVWVGEKEWPAGNSLEVDVVPGGDRAFSVNLLAEPGKVYPYSKEGDEDPGFLGSNARRAKIELVVTLEDFFVQSAKDGKSVLHALEDISHYYAPGSSNWLLSPWGDWGKMFQDALSVNIESAMIQLTFSVAASGLLTPVAMAAGTVATDVAKEIISFVFDQYVEFYAKEYRMTKPTGSQYLGTLPQTELLSTTYQLTGDLVELQKLYDAEIAGYSNDAKLALALKTEISKLSEAVKKAEFIYKKLKLLVDQNYVIYNTIEGREYRSGETGKYSYQTFFLVYRTLNKELELKQKLFKGFTPDLQVKSLTATPAAPVAGQSVTLLVTMENTGGYPAASTAYGSYDLYIDGKLVSAQRDAKGKGALLPGKTWSTTYVYTFPDAGSYTIKAVADPTNNAVEYSETNNERSIVFKVAPAPLADIRVRSLTCSPAAPVTGQVVTFNIVIENVGKGPAAGTGYGSYDLFADGTKIDARRSDPGLGLLQPGKTWSSSSTYMFSLAKTYAVKISVDPLNSVAEDSETNNDKSISVTVTPPPPDLIVDEFTCTPSGNWKMSGKGLVSFSVRIKNIGPGPADPAGYASYTILADGAPVRTVNKATGLPPLQAGKTWSDNDSYTFTDGKSHQMKVTVDPGNKVAEVSETNNDKTVSLQMAVQTDVAVVTEMLPDIQVASLTISPATPKQREMATLTLVVKNAGKMACPAPYYCSYDLYLNGALFTQSREAIGLGPLQPGKTWTTTIPISFATAGANNVKIVMDPDNKVKEMAETNNGFSLPVKVIQVIITPY